MKRTLKNKITLSLTAREADWLIDVLSVFRSRAMESARKASHNSAASENNHAVETSFRRDANRADGIIDRIRAISEILTDVAEAPLDLKQPAAGVCPICHEPVKGELMQDPAQQHPEGICEYCWSRSI